MPKDIAMRIGCRLSVVVCRLELPGSGKPRTIYHLGKYFLQTFRSWVFGCEYGYIGKSARDPPHHWAFPIISFSGAAEDCCQDIGDVIFSRKYRCYSVPHPVVCCQKI